MRTSKPESINKPNPCHVGLLCSHTAAMCMMSAIFPFNYYRPQTKLRKNNVFTPVCHSVHRGVYIPLGRQPPMGRHP